MLWMEVTQCTGPVSYTIQELTTPSSLMYIHVHSFACYKYLSYMGKKQMYESKTEHGSLYSSSWVGFEPMLTWNNIIRLKRALDGWTIVESKRHHHLSHRGNTFQWKTLPSSILYWSNLVLYNVHSNRLYGYMCLFLSQAHPNTLKIAQVEQLSELRVSIIVTAHEQLTLFPGISKYSRLMNSAL